MLLAACMLRLLLQLVTHSTPLHCCPQKNFDSKSQTLRAVTIKQLADASAQRVDDSMVIDGRDVSNVSTQLWRNCSWQEAAVSLDDQLPRPAGV